MMVTVDLAETGKRELNQRLHGLTTDTEERCWQVLNPRGQHSLAAGLDAPVSVEIMGHAGYYCAGMNKQATIRIKGNAGPGTAENMMSGVVWVKGNASESAGAMALLRGFAAPMHAETAAPGVEL